MVELNRDYHSTVFERIRRGYRWICLALSLLVMLSGFLPWLYNEEAYLSAWGMLKNNGAGKGLYYFQLTVIMLFPLFGALINLCWEREGGIRFYSIVILLIFLLNLLQPGMFYSSFDIQSSAGAGIVTASVLMALVLTLTFYLGGSGARTALEFGATLAVYMLAFALYGYHDIIFQKMNVIGFVLLAWALISCMTEFFMAYAGCFNEKLDVLVRWNLVISVITLISVTASFVWLR